MNNPFEKKGLKRAVSPEQKAPGQAGAPAAPKAGKKGSKKYLYIGFAVLLLLGSVFYLFRGEGPPFGAFLSGNDAVKPADMVCAMLTVSDEQRAFAEHSSSAKLETMILDRLAYEILEAEDEYLVLEITAPDMRRLFSQALSKEAQYADSAEEANRIISQISSALAGGAYESVTATVTVSVEYTNGLPEIVVNKAFADAVFGGLTTLYSELLEMAGGV